MLRYYYANTLAGFLAESKDQILGKMANNNEFTLEPTQRDAWLGEVELLKRCLPRCKGKIYFEYSIPRMGRRIDVLCILESALFILEFKVGSDAFDASALDQVMDYALDLKNFHETSHNVEIYPVLIATKGHDRDPVIQVTPQNDQIYCPICCNAEMLGAVFEQVIASAEGQPINPSAWEAGVYQPTPTIIEAAQVLYRSHSVKEISRNDAKAVNLSRTTDAIDEIIEDALRNHRKMICFVTGVPGAGKTLVGLNVATKHQNKREDQYSVFLSGNGPLVMILREALARDRVRREKENGGTMRKSEALSEIKAFIQNVHNFRDECLIDSQKPPFEHVVLFDEAQRAWDLDQTRNFMLRKRHQPDFQKSEPEFLISCLERHPDWALIVCLVGGGQEINTGEAGIGAWLSALDRAYPNWHVYISPQLTGSEYNAQEMIHKLDDQHRVTYKDELHLAVSMRSFRAEKVSLLIKQLLDLEPEEARKTLRQISRKYPFVLTRDVLKAKKWLKTQARGTERYGIVVSSQAERLRPYALDIRAQMDPIHWFLDGKEDVRSSYYLEDVATEFDIQGLELDWVCVTWDADFRYTQSGWQHRSFVGDHWNHIKSPERQNYLKNAYRVLLTRARQGMVIVVPQGDPEDPTRKPEFYDPTYEYLKGIGFLEI